jgi:hypothetical protein
VATIVGIRLFDADDRVLAQHIYRVEDKLTLLPQSIRQAKIELKDDF